MRNSTEYSSSKMLYSHSPMSDEYMIKVDLWTKPELATWRVISSATNTLRAIDPYLL